MPERVSEEHHYHAENSVSGVLVGVVLAVVIMVLMFLVSTGWFPQQRSTLVPQQNQTEPRSNTGGGGSVKIDVPEKIDVNLGSEDQATTRGGQ
ncbi:MAG TPA: hypothetical protein VJB91_00450 [Patescibacteria group bacterium]|nr:hypothetical protein [Patescibacteria group bacterium]